MQVKEVKEPMNLNVHLHTQRLNERLQGGDWKKDASRDTGSAVQAGRERPTV